MAFADKIKISDDEKAKAKQAMREFGEVVSRLSGLPYPPKTSADWVVLLGRAGFSQKRIEQFLCGIGVEGFDDAGRLPAVYTSTLADDWPIFSAMLLSLRSLDFESDFKLLETHWERASFALEVVALA